MTVYSHNQALPAGQPGTALALGCFDGVHIGHQAVIKAAGQYAKQNGLRLAVFTFLPQAKPNAAGSALFTEQQKHKELEELGVEYCFQPPFESFHNLTPRQFFSDMLLGQYRAKALFCGHNFAFGAGRAGNTGLLQTFCSQSGVHLQLVETALYKGSPVSSSRIRRALANGSIPAVNAMLGRPYQITYPVQHGQQVGTKLGFPTINQIYPAGMQAPKDGVYITQTEINGRLWPSTTGYGSRPTLNGVGATCETFIPGFSGDLYGRQVTVRFFEYVSPMVKFASLEELAAAVQAWAKQAVDYFEAPQ